MLRDPAMQSSENNPQSRSQDEKHVNVVRKKQVDNRVPQDRTIVRRVLRTVSLPLFVCMCTISCCGILVALALIIFNIWHKHRSFNGMEYGGTTTLHLSSWEEWSLTINDHSWAY
uniref:Uncharacterized protein n=1 Tax=Glossina pallidipes TaxID=7398 RepID=A0A1A9ZMX9_GLOPL